MVEKTKNPALLSGGSARKIKKASLKIPQTKVKYSKWSLIVICILLTFNFLLFLGTFYYADKISDQETVALFEASIPLYEYPFFNEKSELNLSAKSAIIYEKDSRVVVFKKDENFRFSPASTTKIMTAIVALSHYELDQVLTVPDLSLVKGSKMGLFENEKITFKNLLYGLLLPSGNDAAYTLAYNFPGGEEAFIKKMNEKAKDLKLFNTRFFDPSGYGDDNYTTAIDLARLSAFALENNDFKKVVETKYNTVSDITGEFNHPLSNLNKLLYRQGVHGVKTGYTDEAGGVLVTSFISKSKTYIIVVLKSEDRFLDTQNLIDSVIVLVRLIRY